MAFTYNGKTVEKVNFNNKVANIVKYKGTTILEYDVIYNTTYTANSEMTAVTEEATYNLNFTSNSKDYIGIKVAPTYIHYVDSEGTETNVYAYDTKSWAELYKSITVKETTYVDSSFYDWFKVNYIKE